MTGVGVGTGFYTRGSVIVIGVRFVGGVVGVCGRFGLLGLIVGVGFFW